MNITINVDEVSLSTAVAEIIQWDEEGDQYAKGEQTVADLVAAQIVAKLVGDRSWPSLREQLLEVRKDVLREALTPVIEEAMTSVFQKTNGYGEPAGPKVTMREVIADEVKRLMTQPADSYNRDRGTVLEVTVRKEVESALGAEIRNAVKQAREQVSAEIGQMVAASVQAGLKAR